MLIYSFKQYFCKKKLLQRIAAIFFLFCLHAQPVLNISVWMEYLVNNEYIREVLCINKDRPRLNCDGKCYLTQQLQEQQSPEQQELPQLIHPKYEFVFFNTCESIPTFRQVIGNRDNFATLISCYTHLQTWDIFHPPKV